MSFTANLTARQSGAGATVRARSRIRASGPADYDANSGDGIGTTTDDTPPTAIGDFLDTWDNVASGVTAATSDYKQSLDGSNSRATFTRTLSKDLPYGGSVVAGHRLWAFIYGLDLALLAVSDPYEIT